MFPSQMTAATEELRRWKKPTEEALAFFISFSPMAPVFGVDYRFAAYTKFELPAMPGATPAAPVKAKAKPAKAKTAAPVKPVTKAVAKVADKPAPKTAAKPAPVAKEAAPKPAPKPAEAAAPVKAAPAKPAPVKAVPVKPAPVTAAPEKAAPAKPAPVKVAPVKAEAPAPAPAAGGKPAILMAKAPAKVDDLKMIKGIGPALEKQLNGLGVYTFAQIAGMTKADLTWIDDNLTAFKGRCFRDDWIGQAKAQNA